MQCFEVIFNQTEVKWTLRRRKEKKKKVVYRISLSEVAQNYGDDAYSH